MIKISKLIFRISDSEKGFTLVELILYIALLSIFVGGAITFAWDIMYGRVKSRTQQELSQNLRLATKRIAYEIRNATSITINSPSMITLTYSGDDASRSPTIIELDSGRIRTAVASGIDGECKTNPASSRCYLTSNSITISNLTFTDISAGTLKNIKVSVTGQSTGSLQEYEGTATYVTSVQRR